MSSWAGSPIFESGSVPSIKRRNRRPSRKATVHAHPTRTGGSGAGEARRAPKAPVLSRSRARIRACTSSLGAADSVARRLAPERILFCLREDPDEEPRFEPPVQAQVVRKKLGLTQADFALCSASRSPPAQLGAEPLPNGAGRADPAQAGRRRAGSRAPRPARSSSRLSRRHFPSLMRLSWCIVSQRDVRA